MAARWLAVIGSLAIASLGLSASAGNFESQWRAGSDRTWIGRDYWANRLQDWRIVDDRVECLEASPQRPMRTLQLLTASLTPDATELVMSVRMGALKTGRQRSTDTWAGVLLGAGGKAIDHRTTALVHHYPAEDGGILIAIDGVGKVIFRDNNVGPEIDPAPGSGGALRPNSLTILAPALRSGGGFVGNQTFDDLELRLEARPLGDKYVLTASAVLHATGKVISSAELRGVDPRELEGSVALVSHLGPPGMNQGYWFRDWKMSGRKVVRQPERTFGPILATQYTVHRGVLKLTAQMPPLGMRDTDSARLEVRANANEPWRLVARAKLQPLSYTFPFRVEKWDAKEDLQFRVVYDLFQGHNQHEQATWEGVIRRAPSDREELTAAVLHGNRWHTGPLKWNAQGLWFPHNDLTTSIAAQNPDLLIFTGDQIQTNDFAGVQRTPVDKAALDYLDKWAKWCWAFGDLARQRPTICLPAAQDYFQAQLWGAQGRPARQSADEGGFLMSPEFVNMVQRTQTSHLPDPVDARPVDQDIDVFFTRFDYAGVSFALLEDRKFKTSPTVVVPEGRAVAGRFREVKFDAARQADVAGAELLGDRQLRFVRDWAADWSQGIWMKTVVSSSLFSDAATLPRDVVGDGASSRVKKPKADEYPSDDRLVVDATSNAWPQTGRNLALREMRKGFAVHLAGDQQFGSMVHYGIDEWNDAGVAFSVPSIASWSGRRWFPSEPGAQRKADAPKYTGQYKDGFGNLVTVLAVANPTTTGKEPAALLDRAPGFGVVRFHRKSRQVTFECWPRAAGTQFAGWPITIDQLANYGRQAKAYLPEVKVTGLVDPVVQVVDESNNETVYTLRIRGESYRPGVFREGLYTVRIGEPGTQQMKLLSGLQASATNTAALTVDFADAPRERLSSEDPAPLK